MIEFDGERFRTYTAADESTNVTVNAVAEDGAGIVWVGTDAGGVAKLPRHGVVSFKEEDGLRHDYVTSIWQSRAGRVRVTGGRAVVNEFDGERFVASDVPIPGPLDEPRGYEMVEDRNGDLWVGSSRGLLRFAEAANVTRLHTARPKAIYTIAQGLPTNRVNPTFADSRGDVWMIVQIGADYRVVRWRRAADRFEQFPETDVQLETFGSLTFAEDAAGSVWFGSSRGLARLRDGQFAAIPIQGVSKAVQVTKLHVDASGRLWAGTRGAGLLRSDDPTNEHPRFTVYGPAPQGLSSGTVWCITADAAGDIYLGTPHGVDRLQPDTGQFRHFSTAHGLAGSEVLAAFRDRDGALWFGMFTGVSRLTPQPDVYPREPPTVWIGGLRIRGTAHPLSYLGESNVSISELRPHQNQVQIDFFGLSAETGDPLTYQYRLEGADSAWTTRTLERNVNYAELAPGSYRFQVRAVDAQGRTSAVPASVTFTILRPVWTRWWFLTVMAMLASASGYAFHRYRVTRLIELERLRTRIASDLHDDVGSSLSQISILSEVARARLSDGETTPVAAPLSRIGTLARESVDSMSDIVWAIDPLQDAAVHLLQRMRHFATELLSARGIQLRFESSGDARFRLTADIRRHAYLMLKEIVNNVVRHAEATTVIVEVTIEPRLVQVVVTDDGRGFDTTTVASGQGLRSMTRRASTLGGALEIVTAPGAGTRVSVTLPVV